MAEIRDIVAEQSYQGSAPLGGGTSGVLQIDVKPVEELARFTMFRNKALFDQRQKDIDAKVAELADLSGYDLSNAREKDSKEVTGAYDELTKLAGDYARYTPTSQQDKIDKKVEFDKKKNELGNKLAGAKRRFIAYNARLNGINSDGKLSGAEKDAKLQQLNKEFDDTDILTVIPVEDAYSVTIPQIGEPIYSKNQVTQKDANGVLTSTFQLFDPRSNNDKAFAEAQGLVIEPLPANATENQKQEYEARIAAYKKGGASLYQDAATAFNAAIADPKYQNADGGIDYNEMKSANPLLASTVKLIDDWNAYSTIRKRQMETGAFLDRTGTSPVANLYNPDDYFTIDKTKPLTAQQLIFLQKFKDAVPDGKQEKYDYTGQSIQQQNADTNRMKVNLDGKEFKLKEKQWNASQTGGETVKNGAMEFAKNIYGQLEKIADEKGFISPEKIRQLNNEQLKYLGITSPTTQGGVALNALKVPKGAAIVLRGNQIKVLTNAKFSKEKGYWEGLYDNALSTTVTNVATNRLNEELKNAGKGELNPYVPIDVQDGTTVSENSTSTTSSSSGNSSSSTIPVLTTKAQFDALPAGAFYIRDGKKYQK